MKTSFFIILLLFTGITLYGQKKSAAPIYQKSLAEELKTADVTKGPFTADLNGDNKPDFAFILKKHEAKFGTFLVVIYSKDSIYLKQNLGRVPDKGSMALSYTPPLLTPVPHPFNRLLFTGDEYRLIFEFEPSAGKFILDQQEMTVK